MSESTGKQENGIGGLLSMAFSFMVYVAMSLGKRQWFMYFLRLIGTGLLLGLAFVIGFLITWAAIQAYIPLDWLLS